ncbi:cytochrome P450 4g15-like isoform X1 [Pseudomyrmex gracilis]|uniref:cytochrome P450 4g15-like isoform X1 n=2 Tax=Pseudomyrmex gracilis TaxID=219809 RepID=UPI000994C284|nr:cytochrome P450 4g15-like isoform X1 [Pseudomyrmex gracilis]
MDTIFETVLHLSNTYSLLAIFVVTSLIATHLYIENSRQVRIANKLPGPLSLPLIGNAYLGIGQDPHSMYKLAIKYHKQYGLVGRVYFGTKVLVFLGHPQDIELILGSSVHLDKSVEYRFFQPWLGDGLLITSGKKWYRHRKVIAPTFHISILKSFVPLFYENSIELVRRLRDKIGKDFDCHDYLSAVTVDILTETVMGVKREKRPKSGYDYAMAVMKLSDIIHRRHYDIWCLVAFKLTKYYRLQKKLLKIVHAVTNTVIKVKSEDVKEKLATEQKETQQNKKPTEKAKSDTSNYTKLHYVKDDLDDIDENDVGDKKRLAFLETLITMKQQGGLMTDEEIWEEVNTIMFEGHDTTAAGSSFALCVLGCLPDVQVRNVNPGKMAKVFFKCEKQTFIFVIL